MMESNGVLPVYNLNQPQPQAANGGLFGGGGDSGMGFLLLLLLLFGGFSGGAGNPLGTRALAAETAAAAGYATRAEMQAEIQNGFNQNRLESNLDHLQRDINLGFSNTAQGICNLGTATATGFANLQHNLDMSTCAITSAVREDGNLTRAQMASQREQDLRDQLWQSQLNAQSAQLVNQIVPRPMPAYDACSPYGGYAAPFAVPFAPVQPQPFVGYGCNPR